MKKKIIILALILVSGISLLHSQPVTKLNAADMSSIKSNSIEFSFSRSGNNLVVSATNPGVIFEDVHVDKEVVARLKFTGNSRQEFEAFAGATGGQLKLKLVDETTGKTSEIWPADRENNLGDGAADYRLVITFPESHVYKFMLNGKVIGTGYKPK